MIEIQQLTKLYGTVGIRDVGFACQPGTVTGFLGPNGAGKSTTMRLLCGLSAPDSGTATIDGIAYARLPQPGRRVGVMLDPAASCPRTQAAHARKLATHACWPRTQRRHRGG